MLPLFFILLIVVTATFLNINHNTDNTRYCIEEISEYKAVSREVESIRDFDNFSHLIKHAMIVSKECDTYLSIDELRDIENKLTLVYTLGRRAQQDQNIPESPKSKEDTKIIKKAIKKIKSEKERLRQK